MKLGRGEALAALGLAHLEGPGDTRGRSWSGGSKGGSRGQPGVGFPGPGRAQAEACGCNLNP